MLRGRRSCAISERSTPSPTSQNPLSPLFPLHPGNSPVTPLFPLLTQKQGGGALRILRPFFPFHMVPLPLSDTADSNRLLQERTDSEGVPYTNCELVPIKASFIRVFFEIVEPPTFPISTRPSSLRASAHSAPQRYLYSFFVPDFQPSTFNFELFLSPNSNHSRTSKTFARKSNHSRTYAKTGGCGGILEL